jgi:hypothetical protein
VYFASDQAFAMEGGTISENDAGGKYSGGGGVFIGNGSFTMSAGTISGNKASGVGTSGMGGIVMGGGSGGGMYINGGSFTMSAGTMSGNTAEKDGGGVYVIGRTFTMSGGTISGNTASNGEGGGVYVTNNGVLNMNTGGAITISGNAAKNGGGVYVIGSVFNMKAGTISGNTANGGAGGGVCLDADNFNMEGGAFVDQDNDVWLAAGKKINISAPLTGTPPVARITPSSYSPTTQVLNGAISSHYGMFTVTSNGTNWTINSSGFLLQVP